MAGDNTHFISKNLGQTSKILCLHRLRKLQLHIKHDFSLNLSQFYFCGDILQYVFDTFFFLIWGRILIRLFYQHPILVDTHFNLLISETNTHQNMANVYVLFVRWLRHFLDIS